MRRLSCLLLMTLVVPVMADTVSLRADPWYPYNGQPDALQPGYMIEIARQIFAEQGLALDYRLLNWERSLAGVREGTIDCVVGAYKSDAPDLLFPEHSFGLDTIGFFAAGAASDWRYEDMRSLYNKRIGVIASYSYGSEIDRFVADNADSHWVHTARGNQPLQRNIQMLLAGRLDLLIESVVVMQATLAAMGLSGSVHEVDRLDAADPLYIACSPAVAAGADYIRILDEGMRRLRESGELERILSRYGLSDWQTR
ncbi:MAG TPA: transporter substrate-binding domain-containing protein [Pseudomonadales bacterium]